MPNLVKRDDVRSGRRPEVHHSRSGTLGDIVIVIIIVNSKISSTSPKNKANPVSNSKSTDKIYCY